MAVADVLVLDLVDVLPLDVVLVLEGFNFKSGMSLPVDLDLFEAVFVATVSDMVYLLYCLAVFLFLAVLLRLCVIASVLTSINTPFRTCLH